MRFLAPSEAVRRGVGDDNKIIKTPMLDQLDCCFKENDEQWTWQRVWEHREGIHAQKIHCLKANKLRISSGRDGTGYHMGIT